MRIRVAELARSKRGWSMTKVAKVLDIERESVYNWNAGRAVPRLPELIKLAKLFRCTIDNLIEFGGDATSEGSRVAG